MVAADLNAAAVQFHRVLDNRQAQAGALDGADVAGAVERLEQMGNFVRRDANAQAGTLEQRLVLLGRNGQARFATAGRVLDRVAALVSSR